MILLVADLFHPVDSFAVELFLNGDVRHARGSRRTVPMLLTRREPDHVTGMNFLDRSSPALREAAACSHNQALTQRVDVPCCSSAWFKRDTDTDYSCWVRRLNQGVYSYRAREILSRSFVGGL